uniref:Homing endonuclease n=1 Tax=viral metagenome TaxID=1070528 RepID=A0A6M3JSM7_9ZZZZ
MNDKDIGWLAGVLDGEGCIHASRPWKKENDRKSNGRHHFDIRVIITQNPNLLLEKVGRLLREIDISYKYRDSYDRHPAEINITKKVEIKKLLLLILSELSCKKRSAEVVLEYIAKWPDSETHWGKVGAPESQVKDYIKVYNILKKQKQNKSLESVETTRYTSQVDEDIVRYSE